MDILHMRKNSGDKGRPRYNMTLRVTHENENNLAATDHSIMFKRVSISA